MSASINVLFIGDNPGIVSTTFGLVREKIKLRCIAAL